MRTFELKREAHGANTQLRRKSTVKHRTPSSRCAVLQSGAWNYVVADACEHLLLGTPERKQVENSTGSPRFLTLLRHGRPAYNLAYTSFNAVRSSIIHRRCTGRADKKYLLPKTHRRFKLIL